jgi:hypothetical protein
MLGRWELRMTRIERRPATLEERLDVLNPRVLAALRAGHEALERLGIRHAVVGGLAVGIHGRARATKDVDFLVGPEAFESTGIIVSFRPGVPLSAAGVPIDSIAAPTEHEAVLTEALGDPEIIDGIPVLRAEPLIYMKLIAGRRQDLADVVSILRNADVDVDRVRALIDQAEPSLRVRFEGLLAEALADEV